MPGPGNPPGVGEPASVNVITTPVSSSTTTLPPFSLPPYLQGSKESSNNANFQGNTVTLFIQELEECGRIRMVVIETSLLLNQCFRIIFRFFEE